MVPRTRSIKGESWYSTKWFQTTVSNNITVKSQTGSLLKDDGKRDSGLSFFHNNVILGRSLNKTFIVVQLEDVET